MSENRDLSRFKVLSQNLVSKKVFFSEAHEGEYGAYSLSLIPLQIGRQYKIENCYLSKTRDESYFSKVEDIKIIDRSTQVDLTKYSAEGSGQTVELETVITEFAFKNINVDQEFVIENDFLGEVVPGGDTYTDLESALRVGPIIPSKHSTTGTISSPNNINFTGANSFIINQLIKPILSKNPASTYLEVNLFSVKKTFLYNLISEITEPFEIVTSQGVQTITNRSELDLLFIADNLRDWVPRFIMQLTEDTRQSIFNQLPIIASFSTIDSTQTNLVINYEAQEDCILIVPTAKPQRYSYNLDQAFEQILETIENEGDDTLADVIDRFNTTFESAKTQLISILESVKTQLESDEPLTNTAKAVNIEGIFSFNLKEVEYYESD